MSDDAEPRAAEPTAATEPGEDYVVGYCRPPRASQFKAGQSGNPKGRPKGALSFQSQVDKELKAKVAVVENGRRLTLSKQRLLPKATRKLQNRLSSSIVWAVTGRRRRRPGIALI